MATTPVNSFWLITKLGNAYAARNLGPVVNAKTGQQNQPPKIQGNGTYLQNTGTPTQQQMAAQWATAFPTPSALANAQAERKNLLLSNYEADLANGIALTYNGATVVLDGSEASQARFTALTTLWQQLQNQAWDAAYAASNATDAASKIAAAQAASVTEANIPDAIVDKNQNPITGTQATLGALLTAYGSACKGKQMALLTKNSEVMAANSIAAVNAIS